MSHIKLSLRWTSRVGRVKIAVLLTLCLLAFVYSLRMINISEEVTISERQHTQFLGRETSLETVLEEPIVSHRDNQPEEPSLGDRDNQPEEPPSLGDRDNQPDEPSLGDRDNPPEEPSLGDRGNQPEEPPSLGDRDNQPEEPLLGDRGNPPEESSLGDRGNQPEEPSLGDRDNQPEEPSLGGRGNQPEEPSLGDRGNQPEEPSLGARDNQPEEPSLGDRGNQPEEPSLGDRDKQPEEPSLGDRGNQSEEPSLGDRGIQPEVPCIVPLSRASGDWAELDLRPRNVDVVVYNRVPKCGSSSVLNIIGNLAAMNNFTNHTSHIYNEFRVVDNSSQNELVQLIKDLPKPAIYDRHFFYFNMTQYGLQNYSYINLVRDPVDRVASFYSYCKYGEKCRFSRVASGDAFNMTFEECVLKRDPYCTKRNKQLQFFCGTHDFCPKRDKNSSNCALAQAKQTVESSYLVVGLNEELDSFFGVLEKLLPRYFKSASRTYDLLNDELKELTSTKIKEGFSDKVKNVLKEVLSYEYEFYDFIKQKFHRLADQLGVQSSS